MGLYCSKCQTPLEVGVTVLSVDLDYDVATFCSQECFRAFFSVVETVVSEEYWLDEE